MNCTGCKSPATLRKSRSVYRRGGRSVEIETECWGCPGDCPSPDGDKPFEWYVPSQLKANDEKVRKAWKEKYGEEMPRRKFADLPRKSRKEKHH